MNCNLSVEILIMIFNHCTTATLGRLLRTNRMIATIVKTDLNPSWQFRQLEAEVKLLFGTKGSTYEARKENEAAMMELLSRHSRAYRSDPEMALGLTRKYSPYFLGSFEQDRQNLSKMESAGVRGLVCLICGWHRREEVLPIDGLKCVDLLILVSTKAKKLNLPELRSLSIDEKSHLDEMPLGLEYLAAHNDIIRKAEPAVLCSLETLRIGFPDGNRTPIDLQLLNKLRKLEIVARPHDKLSELIVPPAQLSWITVTKWEQYTGGLAIRQFTLQPSPNDTREK